VRYFRRARKMTVVGRPKIYRGFKVTIMNNNTYSFRYEWKIEAVTQTAKALLLRNYKRDTDVVMYDPTSSRSVCCARDRAIVKVNEMCSPFWWKEWH
jgi:hypothetical protein